VSRPSDTEILREQDKIARTLDTARKVFGERDAEIRCVGMVIGVVSYLTKHYGSRRAYDTIQGITLRPSTIPQRLWVGGGKSRTAHLRIFSKKPNAIGSTRGERELVPS
jgi:hypothetical protein